MYPIVVRLQNEFGNIVGSWQFVLKYLAIVFAKILLGDWRSKAHLNTKIICGKRNELKFARSLLFSEVKFLPVKSYKLLKSRFSESAKKFKNNTLLDLKFN